MMKGKDFPVNHGHKVINNSVSQPPHTWASSPQGGAQCSCNPPWLWTPSLPQVSNFPSQRALTARPATSLGSHLGAASVSTKATSNPLVPWPAPDYSHTAGKSDHVPASTQSPKLNSKCPRHGVPVFPSLGGTPNSPDSRVSCALPCTTWLIPLCSSLPNPSCSSHYSVTTACLEPDCKPRMTGTCPVSATW